jgi:hypothetical protein
MSASEKPTQNRKWSLRRSERGLVPDLRFWAESGLLARPSWLGSSEERPSEIIRSSCVTADCLPSVAPGDDLQTVGRTVSAFRRVGCEHTLSLGLRRGTSRPIRSRFEIIRRVDIGRVNSV